MMELKEDERLDYLLADESMQIIQSATVFSFSIDAVLLSNFARVPIKKGKILDLCTGNGVIPLLLSKKSQATITGVEIQARLYDMARRSVIRNQKADQVKLIHGDLKDMPARFGNNKFDIVTVNPPYFQTEKKAHQNKNDYLTIARHEVLCTLEDVVSVCSKLAKSGGKVAMVHRPNRLVEILTLFKTYKLEPKRLQLVYPKEGKEANILLIEAIRDGNPDLRILPPLYVFDQKGNYTKELDQIIHGNGI
ncbi:tRNA1(Val) (adenine(37)-N6)-methyltransferase [Paraliobacillus sp. PM-2]|uniref:tRNA1(Val) (adenine(37)-N6)-methyltransferase n=1 Tax=Paraliobacillus sp. PM-2 TaxID=1462524 RepID=UPI00061BB17B|nr:tRNA1(Val) (adenine(37)-N6)-methyltransferase [Paraliobacillus sp. PM-2]CQR47500.1 tRNA1(Val) (adenine(37)-N6)-methyltransferase [Paraliobacillus sp. PM-2]